MTFVQVLFCPFFWQVLASLLNYGCLRGMKHDLLKLEVERIIGHRLTSANEFEQSPLIISHAREAFTHHTKTALGISEE